MTDNPSEKIASGPDGAARRLLFVDLRPLKASTEFRRLWIGQSLSGMGNQMTRVAVAIQVYEMTQSSLAVGMVGLAAVVPAILFGLWGGVIIDRVDRRKVVLVCSTVLCATAALFATQALFRTPLLLPLLYALVAVQAAFTAIDGPARRSFIARLLPADLIPAAASLLQLSFQLSLLVGPLVGGLVIVQSGLAAAYLIDAVTFLCALYTVYRMSPMPVEGGGKISGLSAVIEGIRFAATEHILAAVLLVDLCAMVLAMPRALLPAIAVEQLGGGADLIGALYAAPAIGGLIAAVLSGPLSSVRHQGMVIIAMAVVWGGTNAALGFASSGWLAISLLAVGGAADMIGGVFRATLLQLRTPDHIRGRVNSLASVVSTGGPNLGDVRAGLLASVATSGQSAFIGGLACIAGVVLVSMVNPTFRRLAVGFGRT
ncbi:UNVERIFIED_ORG: MFS family permease [Agrobacterium larrymoorei]|uniref:MFS transporter n=1 Tax=Agrobacterium cavarae TaxID=2528239 RepID=A0ABY1YD86_9HYPH|nr:MFS transporter [Agrobacterium cavarae]MDP9573981.1 MFS family permease [Agrobacterium larrymoorei]TBN18456.1 MFS transporter [Agrobacterium cavarae]